MPDPDRLLTTIDRAIDAIRQTPGRRGRLIDLADADEVVVAGDLHGNLANFRYVYTVADLARHPRRHLVLQEVVHSKFRYPDGGDKSHQLLDLFSALKSQFPSRAHLLMGNHELAQWTDRPIIKADEDLNSLFVRGVEEAYPGRSAEICASYRRLLTGLPVAIRTRNRVFLSHSLPAARHAEAFSFDLLQQEEIAAADLAPKGWLYALLWGRDASAANAEAFLRKVDCDWLISGHIPCDQGFDLPNDRQIILDCSAAPAAYVRFPTDGPLTREQFLACVHVI